MYCVDSQLMSMSLSLPNLIGSTLSSRTPHSYKYTLEELKATAKVNETLVPIRLDLDVEGQKIRDTFLWNLNEKLLTPELFAEIMCQDQQLDSRSIATQIAQSIRQQLDDYKSFSNFFEIEDDDVMIIELEINVGNLFLKDRFEWDMGESSPIKPEEFAKKMAAELGLGSEFVPSIAYTIREQIYMNRRMKMNNKAPRRESFNVAIRETFQALEWQPLLERLTDLELEKLIQDKERNARRNRRETRTRLQQRKDEESKRSHMGSMEGRTSMIGFSSSSAHLYPSQPLQPRGRGRPPLYLSKMSTSFQYGQVIPSQRPVGFGMSLSSLSNASSGASSSTTISGGISVASLEDPTWKCSHCLIFADQTPYTWNGPKGSHTLCNSCGNYWSRHHKLPDLVH